MWDCTVSAGLSTYIRSAENPEKLVRVHHVDFLLNSGHPRHATNQNNLIDVGRRQRRILQRLIARHLETFNQLLAKYLQFGAFDFALQMQRAAFAHC